MRQKSVLYLGFSSTSCLWVPIKSFRVVRFEVLAMMNIKIQLLGCDFFVVWLVSTVKLKTTDMFKMLVHVYAWNYMALYARRL